LAALAQSKKNYRPQYDCINLVFDELEICFHPEYQREFIRRLIKMLATFKKLYHQVNVMLLTHSPFILSDIPRSNILYMETEEDKAKNKKLPTHTFAQNIGDMMYDSFFMEKTIGDFAEGKIRKLIKKRLEKDSTKKQLLMSDAEEQAVLSSIGDPVIRSLIDEIEANDD
jgi:AAA15 family ATPase/GTPase